jgi:ribosome-associated protein
MGFISDAVSGRLPTTMDSRKLALRCRELADDKKAEHITVLDLRKLSGVADYFVIATGTSEPHLRAIVDEIEEKIHEETGQRPRARDGTVRTNWVVLDYFDVVIHVMRADAREFYDLESLWGDAPRVRARQATTTATPRKRVKKSAAKE